MKRYWTNCIAAIAIIFVLPACSLFKEHRSAADFGTKNFYVAGERAEKVLSNPDALRDALLTIEGKDPSGGKKPDLRTLIKRLQQATGNRAPKALAGLGGAYARCLVNAAERTLDSAGRFDPRKKVVCNLSGKIRHYYFNNDSLGGYLEVDTRVEIFVNGSLFRRIDYLWAIAVLPKEYSVHRLDTTDPRDPFPGTLTLPDSALDPKNENSIWQRGLNHKLFAKGAGIVVVAVVENGTLLPSSHEFYRRDAENCVDLLFKGSPPESKLPPQSEYCLGRCAFPPIVNTGM